MRLDADWKLILKRAWSVRLMLIAGVLSAAEAVFPFFADSIGRRSFALIFSALTFSALIARIVAQKDMPNG